MGSQLMTGSPSCRLLCPICLASSPTLISNGDCGHAACEGCWRSWAESQLSHCAGEQKRRPSCFGLRCRRPLGEEIWSHTRRISKVVSAFAQRTESEIARLGSTVGQNLTFPASLCDSGHTCTVCFEPCLALITNPGCGHAACEHCWKLWAEARLPHCRSQRTLRPHCCGIGCDQQMSPDIWRHIRSFSAVADAFGALADLEVARIERAAGSEPMMLSLRPVGLQCDVCMEKRPVLLRNWGNCCHAACEDCWTAWAEATLPMLEEKRCVRPSCLGSGCSQTMALPVWRHVRGRSDAVRIYARAADVTVERLRATAADVLSWPPMPSEPGLVCPVCREQCFALLSNPGCEHAACENCWRIWVESQLAHCRGQRRASVRCIGPECQGHVVPTIWAHTCTISEEVHRLEGIFAKRRRLQQNPLYPAHMQVECPRAECLGLAYQGFDTLMCFFCEFQWADDTGDAPELMIGDELVSGLNMKQCPNCQAYIIKNGGCDHMTCRCRHEFWWSTLQPYRR